MNKTYTTKNFAAEIKEMNIELNNKVLKCDNFFIDIDEDIKEIKDIKLVNIKYKNHKNVYDTDSFGAVSEDLEKELLKIYTPIIKNLFEEAKEEQKDEYLSEILEQKIEKSDEIYELKEQAKKIIEEQAKKEFLYYLDNYVSEYILENIEYDYDEDEEIEEIAEDFERDFVTEVKENKIILKKGFSLHLDVDDSGFVVEGWDGGYNVAKDHTAKAYTTLAISIK